MYDLGINTTASATVSPLPYALGAGAKVAAFACPLAPGIVIVTLDAEGIEDAAFSATVPGTAAVCSRTDAAGVVLKCTGLPLGPSVVELTAVLPGGCASAGRDRRRCCAGTPSPAPRKPLAAAAPRRGASPPTAAPSRVTRRPACAARSGPRPPRPTAAQAAPLRTP